jgi:predicted peptidase
MQETHHHFTTTITKRVELDYLLYQPEETPADPPPLMLFLHGAGERGNDLALLKKNGPTRLMESGTDLPFIVLAPQCPAGVWWQIDSLVALLEEFVDQNEVDRARIYLTGLSMGGYGTWALADACPGRFAAVAPVCGPFVYVNPESFSDTPVWCFHGAMDEVVPVDNSIRMVRWLRQSGADVRFTIYPDAGHDSWTQAYAGTELYDWLLEHDRI